jgi:hypothetical protein
MATHAKESSIPESSHAEISARMASTAPGKANNGRRSAVMVVIAYHAPGSECLPTRNLVLVMDATSTLGAWRDIGFFPNWMGNPSCLLL